jgi:hypothetical protein
LKPASSKSAFALCKTSGDTVFLLKEKDYNNVILTLNEVKWKNLLLSVIPAQAGIQGRGEEVWILAFARMTTKKEP